MNGDKETEIIDDEDSQDIQAWIQWFCDLEGHDFFAEVDDEYVRDHFNLYGLKNKFIKFSEALRMILREDAPDSEEFNKEEFLDVYHQACDLYGLIHTRFILTQRGASLMKEKFIQGEFGCCPRINCKKQYVLPIATTEELNVSRVKIFCPRCQDIYVPRAGAIDLDGAYFGLYFPQSFMQFYPELFEHIQGPEKHIVKLYGFKIFGKKGSKYECKYNENGEWINKTEIMNVKNIIHLDPDQIKQYKKIDRKFTDCASKQIKQIQDRTDESETNNDCNNIEKAKNLEIED